VTFLGFCGAPWTVATYMVAGRGTPDQAPARLFAYRHPEAFAHLVDVLVDQHGAYSEGSGAQSPLELDQKIKRNVGVLPNM